MKEETSYNVGAMSTTIITDPSLIELFRLKTIRAGLLIEIRTPMRHSRNAVYLAAKTITGKRTRAAAYNELDRMIKAEEAKAFPPDGAPPSSNEPTEPCRS